MRSAKTSTHSAPTVDSSSVPADDGLISLSVAGKLLAIDGKPLNPCTTWRLVTKGTLDSNGERRRLRATRVGRKYVTRPSWVEEFLNASPATEDGSPPSAPSLRRKQHEPASRGESARASAAIQAARALEEAGI